MSHITPEGVQSFFDTYAMLIMFFWGIIHTRVPILAKLPNALVPWVNCIGYILAQLAVSPAHAAGLGSAASAAGVALVAVRGAFTSALTSLLYDKFVKSWLDRWLPASYPRPVVVSRRKGGA